MTATRETSAWAAGIIDAKGSIVDRGRSCRLTVSSHDRLLLDRLAAACGGSVIGPYENRNADGIGRRPRFVWYVDGTYNVRPLLRRLRRWLSPATTERVETVLGTVERRRASA